MPQWIFGNKRSEKELALERRCHTLEGCLKKTAHKHDALLDYIFQSVLEEYRAYEGARRDHFLEPRSRTLLERRHWQWAKGTLQKMCWLGYRQEGLLFIKKRGPPRRILKP